MTRRGWQFLAIVAIALGLILGGPVAAYDYAQYTRCQSGNDYKRADLKRWDYFISLVPAPPPGSKDAQVLDKVEAYNATADALQHCTLL